MSEAFCIVHVFVEGRGGKWSRIIQKSKASDYRVQPVVLCLVPETAKGSSYDGNPAYAKDI